MCWATTGRVKKLAPIDVGSSIGRIVKNIKDG
jgi:hypothetical protein